MAFISSLEHLFIQMLAATSPTYEIFVKAVNQNAS